MFSRIALRRLRIAANLTQRELAEKAGCNSKEISIYECARKIPRGQRIHQLAQALGVSDADLHKDYPSEAEQDIIVAKILAMCERFSDLERAQLFVEATRIADALDRRQAASADVEGGNKAAE